ncbi:MAG: DAK2 domain-containing protein [Oscillospiraceae bacterium]|nr:DAK2 domain-containing protein [Oscillospiraceae bacterium]
MINGALLRDAFISGAHNISKNRQAVDRLNVFPVPDGDTGTNMSMTIDSAAKELERSSASTVSEVSATAATALLRGARGNSGVILSLLFRGFSKGLKGKEEANARDIAEALKIGVETAYKAVMKPTEGTILTVARLAAEYAVASEETDEVKLWAGICAKAKEALDDTPNILPVLKKAGVVDAGGKGLLCIFEGMKHTFETGEVIEGEAVTEASEEEEEYNAAAADLGEEITFTYCTEFIVMKENSSDPLSLRAYLESIGDSVVVVDDDDIIKVHVHTNNPGNALQEGLKFGSLTKMKIENMREQHNGQKTAQPKKKLSAAEPTEEYGFVSVAAGEGIENLFRELGANHIVSGGQTMNPSTEDILEAVMATPAKVVFVLPNNKNIIMAAEQTISLVSDRKVCVLPTKTIPQGISAMLAFNPEEENVDRNLLDMSKAAENVATGQITFAARDSDYDGHRIKKGEMLGLENGKVAFTEKELIKASGRLAKDLYKKDSSFVTIFYGEDVSEEDAVKIEAEVKAKLPESAEITLVSGGQPVYYVIMSVE